jgi:hypothetical protein
LLRFARKTPKIAGQAAACEAILPCKLLASRRFILD